MEEEFISFIDRSNNYKIEKLINKMENEEDRELEEVIILLASLIV